MSPLIAVLSVLAVAISLSRATAGLTLLDPEQAINKCRYSKAYNLLQAQCKDLKLNNIPNKLKSDIEVLDIRENRIRVLRNDTLARYTNLRYLYLQDNFVQHVDEAAFGPTYYLEVLDFSKNGLADLPRGIFHLNSLRNLYLSDNQLTDSALNISDVRSPLQRVHLSNNRLTRLPQLKPMATVTLLNVSYNEIARISPEDIASLCSLQVLDLKGNPIKFNQSSCDCFEFEQWTIFRKIELKSPLDCPESQRSRCADLAFGNRTLGLYSGCVTNLQERADARRARSTWIWIASCIGVFVGCIFVALCCVHRRGSRGRRQRLKEREMRADHASGGIGGGGGLGAANNGTVDQLLDKNNGALEQS